MDRRRFLKTAAGLFVPAAPALILPASAQGPVLPGPGLPVAGGGGGPFTFVSGTTTGVNGSGGGSSSAIDTTGAAFLIGVVSYFSGASGLSFSDSKGNTWNALTAATSANSRCNIYWCKPSSVGPSHTASFTGTSVFLGISFAAFTFGAVSPADQESVNSGTGTTTSSSSITPGFAGELVISGVAVVANTIAPSSVNGGFNVIGTPSSGSSGNRIGLGAAYLIQTSAAAASPAWTLSGSSEWSTKLASFKVS